MGLQYPDDKAKGFRLYKFSRILTNYHELEREAEQSNPIEVSTATIREQLAFMNSVGSSEFRKAISADLSAIEANLKSLEKAGSNYINGADKARMEKMKFYRDAMSATVEQCLNFGIVVRNKGFTIDLDGMNVVQRVQLENKVKSLFEKHSGGMDWFSFGELKHNGLAVTFPGCFKPSEAAFELVRELKELYPDVSCYSTPSDESLLLKDGFNVSECTDNYETYWKALDGNDKKVSEGLFHNALVRFSPSFDVINEHSNFIDCDEDRTFQLMLSTDFECQGAERFGYGEAYERWESAAMPNNRVDWAHVNAALR